MADNFDWTGFRALVKRLDDLVGGQRDDAEFAEDLRRALTFVYTAGVTMPTAGDIYEDAGGDEFWSGTLAVPAADEPGDSGQGAAAEALADRIGASVESVQPDELGDPDEIAEVATIAAENLLDVLSNLASGNVLFDEKRLKEAQWEWSFGFDEWGAHALSALSALHELLWGAR
jgi:hypothetical protein